MSGGWQGKGPRDRLRQFCSEKSSAFTSLVITGEKGSF